MKQWTSALSHTHTKTTDWAYEKEWRIASWKRRYWTGGYSDYEFHREELQGTTFGALMSKDDRTDLILLVKGQYSHVKLWQATIEGGRRLSRKEVQMSEQTVVLDRP